MNGPVRWGALTAGQPREAIVAEVTAMLEPVGHGARVLIACSGGPDSTALAHLVVEARSDLHSSIVHVRHGLRDDSADAAAATSHGKALGIEVHERIVEVRESGDGPEAAAREARYAAFVKVARSVGARWVLLGHTADDRAETVVMNLARGTGVRGLSGIAASRVESGELRILRPMLRLRRLDVRAFVRGDGLSAVADPSNHDLDQRRRRARDEVLPALARLSGGPGDPVGVLTRLADLAGDDADALDTLAADQARTLVVRWGPARAVRYGDLAALPAALASRVVRLAVSSVRGGASGLSADAVAAVLTLQPGEAAHIGGGAWVTSGGGWMSVAPARGATLGTTRLEGPRTELVDLGVALCMDWPWGGAGESLPGQTSLDLGIAGAPVVGDAPPPPGPFAPSPPRGGRDRESWAVLPAGIVPVAVRARRDGDRIRLGSATRKLQDVFVDARVPRALRDLVPVVVDADDEPLWVPGVVTRRAPTDPPAGARVWLAPGGSAPAISST